MYSQHDMLAPILFFAGAYLASIKWQFYAQVRDERIRLYGAAQQPTETNPYTLARQGTRDRTFNQFMIGPKPDEEGLGYDLGMKHRAPPPETTLQNQYGYPGY
jgi:hypothetical protein